MTSISTHRNAPERIDNSQQAELVINPTPPNRARSSDNSLGDHVAAPQTSNTSPTDGARAATQSPPGRQDIERMTQDRLNSDPEYVDLQAKLETWKNLENDFAAIDQHTGLFTGDGTVTLENLRAIANDPLVPDPTAKAAAQRLLANMDVWNELANGLTGGADNVAGTADVTRFLANMRAQLKAMKASAREEVRVEVGAATSTPHANGAATGGSPGSAASPPEGSSKLFNPPTLSTKPGMEGAVENLGNTLAAVGNASAVLAAQLANPDLKPEERQKVQAKYNELQQLLSMLTNMYTQLQTAIANLMKMYSDVAKNSIQNMR